MSLATLRARFPEVHAWIADALPPRAVVLEPGPAPALSIDGVRLASLHDPRAEAELQARLVPAGAPRATLYGFAQGELVRVLLARAGLERLRVVVLNPGVARAVLERLEADWLADERVELVRPGGLAELEPPFAASPADLRLACDEGARVRDLVVLELATPVIRRHQEERAPDLLARIADVERRFARDPDVGTAFGSCPGARLCVAAAGPTLARHYDELRARARDLIAVDAALKPLLEAGVVPRWVVSVDPHEEGMRRVFAVEHEALRGSTLVYFPEVPPEVLAGWRGARLVARGPGALHRRAPDPRGTARLFSSGSVLHPAVDLARRLGAARIELFGADFAHVDGTTHVAGCAWRFRREVTGATPFVLDGRGRRVPSHPNLVGYLRDLERWIAAHPEVEVVSRSRDGAAVHGARIEEVSGVR